MVAQSALTFFWVPSLTIASLYDPSSERPIWDLTKLISLCIGTKSAAMGNLGIGKAAKAAYTEAIFHK